MRRQSSRGAATAAARREMRKKSGPQSCCRCGQPATDLHEPLCRSRGGNAADPAQCWPVCRRCHDEIHDHPAEATEQGWLIPSWRAEEYRADPWGPPLPDMLSLTEWRGP